MEGVDPERPLPDNLGDDTDRLQVADNDQRDRPLTDEIVGPANSVNLSPAGQAPVRAAKQRHGPLAPAAPCLSARSQLVVGARRTAKRGSGLNSVGRQRNEALVVDGTADREVI